MNLKKWKSSGILTPTRTVGEIGLKNNGGMVDIWIRVDGKERWFAINKFEMMDFMSHIEEKAKAIFQAESDGNAEDGKEFDSLAFLQKCCDELKEECNNHHKEKIYLKKVQKDVTGSSFCKDCAKNLCYYYDYSIHGICNGKRLKTCTKEHIVFIQIPKPVPALKENHYRVNDRFKFLLSTDIYVIKGAWDGSHPNESTCFLMNENGKGHAYAGIATPVKDFWNITEEEFSTICGGHPEWFMLSDDLKQFRKKQPEPMVMDNFIEQALALEEKIGDSYHEGYIDALNKKRCKYPKKI